MASVVASQSFHRSGQWAALRIVAGYTISNDGGVLGIGTIGYNQ